MNKYLDLTAASVVCSHEAAGPEAKAVEVLIEEIAKRTGIQLPLSHSIPEGGASSIVIGTKSVLGETLHMYSSDLMDLGQLQPEGYLIQVVSADVVVIGADPRGVLYGVGKFLRMSFLKERQVFFHSGAKVTSFPHYPIRGHQLGYRPKTNAYDAWTIEQYEQYIRELALFGSNSIEIMPPRTDDHPTSPLMKVNPLEMMIGLSGLIDSYGLDVWVWYPNMAEDYTDPETRRLELREREEIFSKLPRINAIFIPGSDPGGMDPDPLFDWCGEVSQLLSRYHPSAKVWIAPQVMKYESRPWLESFYHQVDREPDWLGGVVYGPHVDETLPDFRARIPSRYSIRRYEDITHNFHCQYPVENWDHAYALTLGRESYNPRPAAQKNIHNVFAPYAQGNISYSEGINDDVNKFVWCDQDWNPDRPVADTLRDYARFLIHSDYAEPIARGLMALEENWIGPLAVNDRVEITLAQWHQMEEEAPPQVLGNYRFQMGLLRAYYDAYVKRRLIYETELEYKAKDALRAAKQIGSEAALRQAEQILKRAVTEPVAEDFKKKCHELADELFRNIGSQLTVERHYAISVGRGAFLDTIDFPLNDADYILSQCQRIGGMEKEEDRLRGIHQLLNRSNPGPGGYYDSFGSHTISGKVDPGWGWRNDPGYLRSPRIGQATYLLESKQRHKDALTGIPLAWIKHLNTMTETPITITYENLDPESNYTMKVTFIGDVFNKEEPRDTWASITLNDQYVLHDNVPVRQGSGNVIELPIPQEALASGRLKLTFKREKGFKRLNIAEIWIMRQYHADKRSGEVEFAN